MEHQRDFVTKSMLKSDYGLTEKIIAMLGEPDVIRQNQYFPKASVPMRLYDRVRVEQWVGEHQDLFSAKAARKPALTINFEGTRFKVVNDGQYDDLNKLSFKIHADSSSNVGHFVRMMNEVWDYFKIIYPTELRGFIRHIRGSDIFLTSDHADQGLISPRQMYLKGIAGYHEPTVDRRPRFYFWNIFLEALPDELAAYIIAYQLGHALCYASASGVDYPCHLEDTGFMDGFDLAHLSELADEEVIELLECLDFHPIQFHEYWLQHHRELPMTQVPEYPA